MRSKARGPLLGFGKPALAVLVIALIALSSVITVIRQPQQVAATPNNYINFQARLMNGSGAIVPDGFYNVEFKLYNVSSGGSAQWTETWYDSNGATAGNDNRVRVQNGYLTVSLGSQTAFPGTINWDQQQWITMNIGGTTQTATPTWDGEMSPRLQLTAVPYAFQAAKASELEVLAGSNTATLSFAGTFGQDTTITLPDPGAATATVCYQGSTSCGFATGTSGSYIQNGTSVQTNANFNIRSAAIGSVGAVVQGANGQTADLLQLQSYNGASSTNVFSVNNNGVTTLAGGQTIDITTATASTATGLTLAPGVSSAASGTGATLTLTGGAASGTTSVTGGQVTIQGGNATGGSGTRNGGNISIDGGTGATANGTVNIGTANSPIINIGSVGTTAKATTIHIGDTTTTTGGAIQNITIGSSSNLAHTTIIQGGNSNTAGSEAIRILPQTTGGVAIGSTTGTGTITLGQANASNTINIGSADFTTASTQTINIANGLQTTAVSTLNVNILSSSGNGVTGTAVLRLGNNDRVQQIDIGNVVSDGNRAINVFTGNTGSGVTDTINIGTGNALGSKVIHIGDGTPSGSGSNVVTIGTTAGSSSTTTVQGGTGSGAVSIQSGSGGTISIGSSGVANTVQVGNTSGAVSQTINIGNNATASATNTVVIGSGTNANGTVTINSGVGSGNGITMQSNNSTGGTVVKSGTNSTVAFQLQNGSGTNGIMMNFDSSNGWIINNAVSTGGNLLQNPGFESNGSFQASGWNYNAASAITVDNTNSRTGNNMMITTGDGVSQKTVTALQYITAVPGDQFYAELWYKTAVGTNGGASGASFSFAFYDANKAFLSNSTATNMSAPNTTYTRMTATGTAPASTVYVRLTIAVNAASTGNWYFDDTYISKINQIGPQLFKNSANSTAAFAIQDASANSFLNVDTSGGNITVGYASSTTTLNGTVRVATLGSATGNSQAVCRDTSTNTLTSCDGGSGGLPFIQGGNSFGTTAVLGTNDSNSLQFETNNVVRATFGTSNDLFLGNGVTAATPNNFTLMGTGSATAGTTGAQLNIQGGAGATTTTGSNGGVLNLSGGNAGGSGNNNGGSVLIQGGTGVNSGVRGNVVLQSSGGSVGIGMTPSASYRLDVAGDINISSGSAYRINGASINTGGTLTNVAYLDQNNAFTGFNTFSRNGTGTGDYTLGVTGTPVANATSSLIRVGNAIASGNAGANGGTYIGINAPSSGAGSAANFFDFQANGSSRLQLTNGGTLTIGGTPVIQAAASTKLDITGNAASTWSTSAGDLSIQAGSNLNLGNGGGTGINIGTNAGAHTIAIGTGAAVQGITIGSQNTTSTTAINGGNGSAAISLQAASGGTITIGNTNSNNVTIGGASSTVVLLNTVQIGSLGSVTANTRTVCRDDSTGSLVLCDATIGSTLPFLQNGNSFGATAVLGTDDANNLQVQTNSVVRATFDQSNGLYLGLGVTNASPTSFTLSATGSSAAAVAGAALTVKGGTGASTGAGSVGGSLTLSGGNGGGSGSNAGGAVTIQGGQGSSTGQGGNVNLTGGTAGGGNNNGGTINISGGTGTGTGATGLVVINTPTFQTASTQSCGSNCTITQANVDGNGAVVVNATAASLTVTMNDPTIATAGRIVYVTAANGSNDFTLSVNGGGTGNQIAMRQNTTATMVWNGSDWTAAGASSSTTLQAAYDNTLTSAGGAELVLSNTANANGLTIRDSSANPVNGTLLEVQSSSAANLFSVNSNVTDYATDAGAEVAGASSSTFPASTWSANGSASTSRYITAGNFIATGIASVATTTTAAAGDGVKNTLSTTLTANNHYNVSFTARLASGTFTDMDVYFSINGTATSVLCASGQAIKTSVWTKVNCTFTAPSSGITSTNAILIRQTAGAVRTFYVDNLSVTIAADFNLATDGGVSDAGNFATNWSTAGLGSVTVTRNTTDGQAASDSAQAAISSGAANAGLRNKLSINPLTSTLYRVSVYAKLSSGTFTDFKVRYSRDAGTNFVDCADYNTQTVSTSAWTQITCYISTDGTAPSNPYVYFVETASATRTYMVDTFSMTLANNTTPNVQIGGGLNGGPVTLFTLDRGASAPIAANNDAFLGSMYYDTTLGKLQCYEADGWGACGSSPDNIVTISPEYTNAVLHGSGVGTMTSDMCSDQLNINDGSSGQPTICNTNETYNFYRWTSPQASAQTYSIYVTYQLPTTFKSFSSGNTSIMGRTDSTNATVQYSVYRNSGSGLTQCGSTVSVSTGVSSSWTTGTATGSADPSTCGFSGGNSIVFKIDVIASVNANAYVGNLNFTFTNQ